MLIDYNKLNIYLVDEVYKEIIFVSDFLSYNKQIKIKYS